MAIKVTTDQAKTDLRALVSRVAAEQTRILIENEGTPVAALVSVADLDRLEGNPTSGPRGAQDLVGMWADLDDDEVDAMVEDIYAERSRESGRQVTFED